MSSLGRDRVDLGEVEPAGSRHLGRRSAVLVTDEHVVVGTASGDLRAFDHGLDAVWRTDALSGSVVSLAACGDVVVAGERGTEGAVVAVEVDDGERRWRYETTDEVGEPTKDARFQLPFVADVVADEDRVYAASRRYERREPSDGASGTAGSASRGSDRHFESAVYAFDPAGRLDWQYTADASPISLDVRDDRLGVAYNRCTGDHQCGLVVLDCETGVETATWDPGTGGQRRVGDVALVEDGAVVASHGDYHGYRLDRDGGERWRVPLATPTDIDAETVYAYPNHVHATDDGAVFVTGNTYPEDGRQTDARHPNEHTAAGYDADGARRWTADVGGFASGIGTDGDSLAVPGAQHFRARTADTHGLRVFDLEDGQRTTVDADGVVTAASLGDGLVAAVEEPVTYHDDDDGVRGRYRLQVAPAR